VTLFCSFPLFLLLSNILSVSVCLSVCLSVCDICCCGCHGYSSSPAVTSSQQLGGAGAGHVTLMFLLLTAVSTSLMVIIIIIIIIIIRLRQWVWFIHSFSFILFHHRRFPLCHKSGNVAKCHGMLGNLFWLERQGIVMEFCCQGIMLLLMKLVNDLHL